MINIRVLLVEDHHLVRNALRTMLEQFVHIHVVAEAQNGREAIQMVADHQPDIVLMDISMENLNGISATEYIGKYHPDTRVLILSVHAEKEYVLQALRAGAKGYLLKNSRPEELQFAIETIMQGETYLTASVSKYVIDNYLNRFDPTQPAPQSKIEKLSLRQREILQLIVEGHSSRQIAEALNIGIKTVETHRRRIKETLHVKTVPDLVRLAIREGLTPLTT